MLDHRSLLDVSSQLLTEKAMENVQEAIALNRNFFYNPNLPNKKDKKLEKQIIHNECTELKKEFDEQAGKSLKEMAIYDAFKQFEQAITELEKFQQGGCCSRTRTCGLR